MAGLNYEIDFLRNEVFEGGALLLSLLAHPPNDKNEAARENLFRSLCHLVLRGQYLSDKAKCAERPLVKPVYAFRDEKQLKADLRTFERRLRDRVVAGRAGIPYFERAVGTLSPTWRPDLQPLTLDKLSVLGRIDLKGEDEYNGGDDSNFETQTWRPSLSVIHLAIATAKARQDVKQQTGRNVDTGVLLTHKWLIERIVYDAQLVAEALRRDPRFPNRKKRPFVHLGIRQIVRLEIPPGS